MSTPSDDAEGLGFEGPTSPPAPGASASRAPLAERMRPRRLEEIVGQGAVLGEGTFLREAARAGRVPSLVLWGPPGAGKTTIARALACAVQGAFVALSAVTSGVKEVRAVIEEARGRRQAGGSTLLFVDEIHRFNKTQQDAFLPHVEAGTIVLVGATTENPAFSLTRALLSRLRVVVLEPLPRDALATILARALADPERGLAARWRLSPAVEEALLEVAEGDARRALNALEGAAEHAASRVAEGELTLDDVRQGAQRRVANYDRGGDRAYDARSAFHKSLRGSDPDAALYWMARMLEGGEDPLVLARRLVAMACEDVGLADLHAARIALEAVQALDFLGPPEGELALVRAVVYLATAPKSNAVVRAMGAAHEAARRHPNEPVPLHLRNAPTDLARSLGHGEGYRYPHDHPHAVVAQDYLPPGLRGLRLYEPVEVGDEREVARRLAYWRRERAKAQVADSPEPS